MRAQPATAPRHLQRRQRQRHLQPQRHRHNLPMRPDSDFHFDLDHHFGFHLDLDLGLDRHLGEPSDPQAAQRCGRSTRDPRSRSAAVVAGASTTRLAVRHIRHRDPRLAIRHSHRQRSAHGQDLRRVDRVLDRRADRQRCRRSHTGKRVADAAPARCRARYCRGLRSKPVGWAGGYPNAQIINTGDHRRGGCAQAETSGLHA